MYSRLRTEVALVATLLTLTAPLGLAQTPPPDGGAILRGVDPAERRALPPPDALPGPAVDGSTASKEDARVRVTAVKVVGSTRFDDATWNALFSDVTGQELAYGDMRRLADRVTRRYRAEGRFARAYLPEQTLRDGVLTVAVIEATLGNVRVETPEDGSCVDESLVRDMLTQRQNGSDGLAIDDLERAALLLDQLHGIRTAVILAPGANPGETDILARIDNTRRLRSRLSVDNGGVESTGRERLNADLRFESPLHRGDQISGLLGLSEGTTYGNVGYELPIGSDGWSLRADVSMLDYDLGGRFDALDADGRARAWSLTASYPWIRTTTLNLRVAAGYEERRYENFALGLETSEPKVKAYQASLSFDRLDALGGGGLNQFGLQLTRGDLDLSGNATDLGLDAATSRRDGSYTKVSWNLARLQRLAERDRLLLEVNGQFASRNLGSSEKMSLGGTGGVRAFPVLEASGDEGWVATAEWIHSLPRQWRVSAFYDYGEILQHDDPWTGWNTSNPNLRNRYALEGVGASVGWTAPRGFELNGTVATRSASNPARDLSTRLDSDGSRREPQFWFTSRWQF